MTEAFSDSHNDQMLSGSIHPTVHPRYEFDVPPPAFHNTYPYGSTVVSGNVEPGHVPDGTFENTWESSLNPGSEHIQSGVLSESDVMTGFSEYVPLEQSDYASEKSGAPEAVSQSTEVQALADEVPIAAEVDAPELEAEELPRAGLSAVEEMMATVIKTQEATAKPKTQKPLGQEVLAPEATTPVKEEAPQKQQPRHTTIPRRLASRPASSEVFATVRPGAPAGTYVAAAIVNNLLNGSFGLGPEGKSAPADPLDIYEPQYAEQLKSAREIIRAEVAKIDASLNDGPESNRQAREADRRKQLRGIVDQAEKQAARDNNYDDDIDLYQVSIIQRDIEKLRDAAEKRGESFGKSEITKLYGRNYERASQLNQPNAPEIDDATRQKYLAQERRAKIVLLFRRTDGSYPF